MNLATGKGKESHVVDRICWQRRPVILAAHGQPAWRCLQRRMIPDSLPRSIQARIVAHDTPYGSVI